MRLHLERHVPRNRPRTLIWEFLLFVLKSGWACVFGGALLSLELITRYFWPQHAPFARYDVLFLAALLMQLLLLAFRLETVREARVILLFHAVGTAMELFKTHVGSWSYPGDCFFRVGHVPLFSGFMYASVGSYIARITRIFDLRYTRYPRPWVTAVLALLIYANFFTNHFMRDARFVLFLLVAAAFGPTWVYYRSFRQVRRMPLLVGFTLVALFIWAAENISTLAGVWVYPHQRHGWQVVRVEKLGSWLLLMIVSFILVASVHTPAAPDPETAGDSEELEGGAFAHPLPAESGLS